MKWFSKQCSPAADAPKRIGMYLRIFRGKTQISDHAGNYLSALRAA